MICTSPNTRRGALAAGLGLCMGATAITAQAALPTGTILDVESGAQEEFCPIGGTPPNCDYGFTELAFSGSWFSMDTNGDASVAVSEITLTEFVGDVPVGVTVPAIGSHVGTINGAETPAFDIWEFFGNTGMHQLTAPLVETSPGSQVIDMFGWDVTWNGIPSIPMRGDFANFPEDPGLGTITCNPDPCADGSSFVLSHVAHVPVGDPSGFGGVRYALNLEGTVIVPEDLSTDADGIGPGSQVGAGSIRVTVDEMADAGIPADDDEEFGVQNIAGAYFDFDVDISSNPGGNAQVVIPLSLPLPADAGYRSYDPADGTWKTFVEDGSNTLESAPGAPGRCSGVDAGDWEAGLVEGYYCARVTIQDNGSNDRDTNLGVISDPAGIGSGKVVAPPPVARGHDTSGCTAGRALDPRGGGAWALLAGFIAFLGIKGKRGKRSV